MEDSIDWWNKEQVLEAVKNDGWALNFASPNLQADREVVMEAVKKRGNALEDASPELKADREVVMEAIKMMEMH